MNQLQPKRNESHPQYIIFVAGMALPVTYPVTDDEKELADSQRINYTDEEN